MNLFSNLFPSKKQEALKTDELRRKTHAEVADTKGVLETKFAYLSELVDNALSELKAQNAKPVSIPMSKKRK